MAEKSGGIGSCGAIGTRGCATDRGGGGEVTRQKTDLQVIHEALYNARTQLVAMGSSEDAVASLVVKQIGEALDAVERWRLRSRGQSYEPGACVHGIVPTPVGMGCYTWCARCAMDMAHAKDNEEFESLVALAKVEGK